MLGGRNIRGLNSPYWDKYKHKVGDKPILGFGLHEQRDNTITVSHPFTMRVGKGNEEIMTVKFP